MSKKEADLNTGSTRRARTPFSTTRRGNVAVRRAAASSRLAREARQQRLAYFALFGVIVLVLITLIAGALWEYVLSPAQPVATVNGVTIRTDTFNRFKNFEGFLLQNQINGIQSQIGQLQADTKHAAANAAVISQLQQQLQLVQGNASNVAAYTAQQMESALEQTQAAAKIGQAPTPAQLDAAMINLQKQAGGPPGYHSMLQSTGVQPDDLRTYFASLGVVQNNVTNYLSATVPKTQPEGQARHILVSTKARALQLQQAIRAGANFGALAKKWSIDNGLSVQPGTPPLTGTAKLQAEEQSSAWNGGWLRDPSQPFARNKPTWITPQTSYVAQVLNAILAMKPGEVRVVQSQFGYHVIQVTAHRVRRLTKAEITTQAQQKFQQWQTDATSAAKNKVMPPDPFTQFPAPAPTTVGQ